MNRPIDYSHSCLSNSFSLLSPLWHSDRIRAKTCKIAIKRAFSRRMFEQKGRNAEFGEYCTLRIFGVTQGSMT